MSPLSVILTIVLYFAVLFTVSHFAGRRADNAGFFTGNRRSSWYMVAFAMIGASMSGVTYVSVPGMVATSSFGYLQMTLGFTAGQLVIAYVLVPLFYRMKPHLHLPSTWPSASACAPTTRGHGSSSSRRCWGRR